MSSPFIDSAELDSSSITVNGVTMDYMGNDVTISSASDKQVMQYDAVNSKWINASSSAGSSTLSGCTNVSLSSPSNDQILMFTTDSSLNKWTAYTISGATFNDTNKTITFAGTTSLSGLTTDVSISSPNNNDALLYNSTSSKWQNTSLSTSNLSDFYIHNPVAGQFLMYAVKDLEGLRWRNTTISTHTLSDVATANPLNDEIFVYTTYNSANKYTPYSIIGATFNDSNRTITISGTTALSGLTTDVTISSAMNANVPFHENALVNVTQNQQIITSFTDTIGGNIINNAKAFSISPITSFKIRYNQNSYTIQLENLIILAVGLTCLALHIKGITYNYRLHPQFRKFPLENILLLMPL